MIKFKTLSREFIDKVLEIEKQCFPGEEWSYGMFESELKNRISVFIIGIDDENGQVVCYGCIWLIADIGEITNIAVAPAYQGEGLGEKTLEILINLCKENGAKEINLEVKENNFPAISLYKKFEFETVGMRRNYYKDGSAAILMTKYI